MSILKAAFRLKKHEFIAYRSNVLLNFLFGCVPLILSILLWKAIYGSDIEAIGGYSYRQMVTYYLIAFILSQIIDVRENTVKISEMIQSGSIHNYLLKPVGFLLLNFRLYWAEKLVYVCNIIIPYMILCALLHQYIFMNISCIPFFISSVCLAFLLKYIIGSILGFLTTWVEEISGLLDFWDNIERFLSGGLLPLSVLPASLCTIISWLPFQYVLFVPINMYMGNMTQSEMLEALAVQIIWIVILGLLLYVLKAKAYRRYSGYGA